MRTLTLALAAALAAAAPRPTPGATPAELARAVADCRGLTPDAPLEKQERFGAASQELAAAGEDGVRALEAELAKLRAAKERDVIFQSVAAEVILDVRREAGFGAAAEALRGVDPHTQLRHLWPTLTAAAASRDPRALPLLRLALATDEESAPTSFPAHGMTVPWPHTLYFLYGAFGQGACDELVQLAARPPVPREDASVAFVVARLRCTGAAPALRRWAAEEDAGRASAALRALGELGDPADAPLLLACAARSELEVRRACAYGLWELSAPATAPAIRALLEDRDERVRLEAISAAFHLPDEEGMAAVMRRRKAAEGKEAEHIEGFLGGFAKGAGMEPAALAGGDPAAWKNAIAAHWARRDHVFDRRAGDPDLSRADLEQRLAGWEKSGRVERTGDGELRAVLSVARAEDLPPLLRALGRVLLRQSDECLDEVHWLDRIARAVHRRAIGHPKPNE